MREPAPPNRAAVLDREGPDRGESEEKHDPSARRTLRVLWLFRVRDALREWLSEPLAEAGVELVFPETASANELLALAAEAEVLVGWHPTRQLLRAARKLELFILPAAGIEEIAPLLRDARRERDFLVVNGHGNAYLVAQHAVALLLALTNRVVPHHNWMAAGRWRTGDREGSSLTLRQRTVGLLGYGAINRQVHRFLSGFDLDFCALRRSWVRDAPGEEDTATSASLRARFMPEQLGAFLERSDVVIAAVPETPATRHLLGTEELRRLGPESLLVNVGRASLVEETVLHAALESGAIGGAAIDVWYQHDPAVDRDGRRYPYREAFHLLPNVVLSPHRAASPLDDLPRWLEVVENLRRFARGSRDLLNLVDLEEGY